MGISLINFKRHIYVSYVHAHKQDGEENEYASSKGMLSSNGVGGEEGGWEDKEQWGVLVVWA